MPRSDARVDIAPLCAGLDEKPGPEMLQFIRSKVTSIFIKFLFGILILSFAIWGIGDIFLGSPGGRAAIKVGEVNYNSAEVLEQFDRARRAMRLPPEFDEQLRPQILNSVIESMTELGLYEAESQSMDLVVGEDQLKSWVASAPAFRDSLGQFNPDVFRQALFNAGLSEGQFFQTLRNDIKRDQLNAAVAGDVQPPQAMVEALFRYREERRTAKVVVIGVGSINNPPEPTTRELQTHYEVNKQDYMAPEYRGITVVELNPDLLAKEILIPEEDLRAEYADRLGEFTTPAKRVIDQFFFENQTSANKAIESLTGPLDIAGVSAALKAAAGDDKLISLGEVAAYELSTEAEREAAFSVKLGKASRPVETPFGWKVFLARSATPESVKSFDEVRSEIQLELAREKALDAQFELSNALEDELAGGSTIEEAARASDLPTRKIQAIDARGMGPDGNAIKGLHLGRRFLETVFRTSENTESNLVETEDDGYVLFRLDRIEETRQLPYEAVVHTVRDSWLFDKRLAIATEKAMALADAAKRGIGLEVAATKFSYHIGETAPFDRTGEGLTPDRFPAELAGVVFGLTKGEVGVVESDKAVAVTELSNIFVADKNELTGAWSNLNDELSASLRQDLQNSYLEILRNHHDVVIDRGYLDTLMAEYQ